jgi:hypothetical protein
LALRKISAGRLPNPIALGASVNLDTITAPGNYLQLANANAANGTNYPIPKAGMLEVFSNNPGGAFGMGWQRYTVYAEANADGAAIFQRALYNLVWQPWEAVNRDTVSTAEPSGTAYEGAMWYKV